MKKSAKVTISLVLVIIMIAVGGLLYKENYFGKEAIEPVKEQQIEEVDLELEKDDENAKDSDKIITESNRTGPKKGEIVTISGTVEALKRSKDDQHLFLTVTDSTYGELLVPIFSNAKIDQAQFSVGIDLVVTGKVDNYYGQLEVIPRNSEDILFNDTMSSMTNADTQKEEALETTQSADVITNDDIDQEVVIEGPIVFKYDHPDGHLFLTIQTESNQEITVPIFSSLSPNSGDYRMNARVQVKGIVKLYKNELQVIPDSVNEVTIIGMIEKQDNTIILSTRKIAFEKVDTVSVKDWSY